MLDVNNFDELRIGLATADDIRRWSRGEVKKPETINYRTLKPEKDGLFCERIFGPTRDWECACGKYKRVRFKGIICERCGVEVTKSKVRRERMGHIELAAPVTHIWYFKGVPSRLGYLLDLAPKDLEKIIYFAANIITSVDEEARHNDQETLEADMLVDKKLVEDDRDQELAERAQTLEEDLAELEAAGAKADARKKVQSAAEREMRHIRERAQRELDRLDEIWNTFIKLEPKQMIIDEGIYTELVDRYEDYFTGGMGAEAIQTLIRNFDLAKEAEELREIIRDGKGQKKMRALKRLKVVTAFLQSGNDPAAMVLDCIPVIPPELRPMVQLDGGRFATSDLNDLYRRVINRNNRLKRMIDLGAPEIIVNNEKRMLQESVDALFDNGRRGRPVTGPGNRPLKSLSDLLKGKQGRFRQNLLGKRVDYSGRSVIVVGPQLRLHQCGLPKQMALELFKPFVMKRLVERQEAQNVKAAKRMVERQRPQVWDVLDEVITEHPVLLNRAPTLHRLGIQAFEPILIEGKAIQLHPLACGAFNADFDGDQMAVHLPLGAEAQAEARILMLSSNNILKPADGRPVTMPSQDMVIGIYHLTSDPDPSLPVPTDEDGNPVTPKFSSLGEAIMAYDQNRLDINAKALIRFEPGTVPPKDWQAPEGFEEGDPVEFETSIGRCFFNEALPVSYPFVNEQVDKKGLSRIVNTLAERYDKGNVAASLDALKETGFHWATWSGTTIGFADVVEPPVKAKILAEYDEKATQVQEDADLGLITAQDRYNELVDLWTECTAKVAEAMRENFPARNQVNRMVSSGARGNWDQIRQISGMRGLVADPKQKLIEQPIKSNYRSGLSVLEYFIATHGARKGLADTALRTADSGYLTRRLVDVSQDVIVREQDCGTRRGLVLPIGKAGENGQVYKLDIVETTAYGRTLSKDVTDKDGNLVFAKGTDVGDAEIDVLIEAGVTEIPVRSVLTCESEAGTCASCYGRSLATGKRVDIGEAVGIIAAQSIGEPGTQLTMRTFHTGGAAGAADITQGLPRVQELFEARTPKGEALITEAAGRVKVVDEPGEPRHLVVVRDDGQDDLIIDAPRRMKLIISDGDHVEVGEQLTEGRLDPKKVLRILGVNSTQKQLVNEVQEVYRSQGVDIHSKHIEVIVRQMLRRVTVLKSGDTDLLPGTLVDSIRFRSINRKVVSEGGEPAAARPELMGITKASLATDSWLSAASFQETTKVLTDAAMAAKKDPLVGLKENVIIGKLIPAGTGLSMFRDASVEPTEEAMTKMGWSADDFKIPDIDDDFLAGINFEDSFGLNL